MKPAWLNKNIHFFYRISHFFAWAFFKIFYRLKVYGHEHFIEGKGIIAGNHASNLDPPAVAVSWPEEIHFLAKESLFKVPLLGRIIIALNSHPVHGNGSDAAVFKLLTRLLHEGKKVIIFPEGGRTYDGKLQPIKPGISLLTSKTSAPIIPVYIDGTYKIWNRLKRFPRLFGKVRCVFGSPIKWSDFAHLDKKETQNALADRLTKTFEELRDWLHAGAKGISP